MSKRVIICFLFIFLALTVSAFSQAKINKKKFVGKNYWTKFVLATDGDCKIEITPNDISPSEKICNFDSHIKTNTEIKLKELFDEKDWARLIFRTGDGNEFEVFLKNDSKTNFSKSFNIVFSDKSVSKDNFYPGCNVKSKLDVIKKLGFPTSISRDTDIERWTFGASWIYWDFCNYDVTFIDIKNGKVVSISGLI